MSSVSLSGRGSRSVLSFRPCGRVPFLCLYKEKEPKEKTPWLCAAATQQYPAMLAGNGATETRPAAQDSDTRSLHPFPAVLPGATQRGPHTKDKKISDARPISIPPPASE